MKVSYTHLKRMISGRGLGTRLIRGGIGSIAVKALASVTTLAVGVVLARSLGPGGYGIYAFVFAATSVALVPVRMGVPMVVMRETSKAVAKDRKPSIAALWRWATGNVFLTSAVIVTIALVFLWFEGSRVSPAKYSTFLCALPLLLFIGLSSVRSASLRGLHHVVIGQLPEAVLRPLFLLVALGATSLLIPQLAVTPSRAMALHSLAAALAFTVAAVLLRIYRPSGITGTHVSRSTKRDWFYAALPLGLLAGAQTVTQQTDLLMLGFLGNGADVGLYRVAVQGGLLVNFGAQALSQSMMPYFSSIHASGDRQRLQRVTRYGAYATTALAAVFAVTFLLFGRFLLSSIFGPEYEQAYIPLCILAVAKLFSTCLGQVGALVRMTGYERQALRVNLAALLVNGVLNMSLIPYWGMTGAAVATGLSLFGLKIALWLVVRRNLGINASVFSARING